jgi:hypothetical protein
VCSLHESQGKRFQVFRRRRIRKDRNKGEELTPEKLAGAITRSKPRTKFEGDKKIREKEWFYGQMLSGPLAKSSDLTMVIRSHCNYSSI